MRAWWPMLLAMGWLDREGARTTLVVVLLVVTLLVTAFMAFRAQQAATYHRTTAERVIVDWARYAADETARRAEAQMEFYGAYPVLQLLAAQPSIVDVEGLRSAAVTAQQKRAVVLVRRVYRLGVEGTNGTDRTMSPAEQVLARIAADPPAEPEPVFLGNSMLVHSRPAGGELVAFEADPSEVIRFAIPAALGVRPLLPPSLAEGKVTNELLFVRVVQGGQPILTSYGTWDERLGVRKRVEEGYLRGSTIDVAIAPEARRMIVFGGVPRTLPIYLVLLLLAAGLTALAVLQLAKERSLVRLRSEFVANVSHELRTPLTQIRMFAETLLLDRVRSDDERRHALAVIDRESRRLTQLVENVLQFSRGERGRLQVSPAPRDVAALVRETVDAFAPIAAARAMSVVAKLPSSLVAPVDDDAMRQIVLNLLDNAAKYGPDGQTVHISLDARDRCLILAIEDEGPGIPPRDRERVWRRYVRLDRERDRAIAGAGIGLAVVRELVRLHRGTTRVEEGSRGARFIIELPVELPLELPAEVPL